MADKEKLHNEIVEKASKPVEDSHAYLIFVVSTTDDKEKPVVSDILYGGCPNCLQTSLAEQMATKEGKEIKDLIKSALMLAEQVGAPPESIN